MLVPGIRDQGWARHVDVKDLTSEGTYNFELAQSGSTTAHSTLVRVTFFLGSVRHFSSFDTIMISPQVDNYYWPVTSDSTRSSGVWASPHREDEFVVPDWAWNHQRRVVYCTLTHKRQVGR